MRRSHKRAWRNEAKAAPADVHQTGGAACGRGVVGLLGGRGHAPPRCHHTPRLGAAHPPNGKACVPQKKGRSPAARELRPYKIRVPLRTPRGRGKEKAAPDAIGEDGRGQRLRAGRGHSRRIGDPPDLWCQDTRGASPGHRPSPRSARSLAERTAPPPPKVAAGTAEERRPTSGVMR